MRSRSKLALLAMLSLLLLVGCNLIDLPDEKPPSKELVWVAIDYSGGKQCQGDNYEPPSIKRLLEAEAIAVYATEIQRHPVCEACGCPDYAATHYAQIEEEQLDEAERLSFRQEQPPENDRISLANPPQGDSGALSCLRISGM